MEVESIRLSMRDLVQQALDNKYGAGKAQATNNNYVKFLFPETVNGTNEMQVGTWAIVKGEVRILVYATYESAEWAHKGGRKVERNNVLKVNNWLA